MNRLEQLQAYYDEGLSAVAMAKRFNVSRQTIYTWLKELKLRPPSQGFYWTHADGIARLHTAQQLADCFGRSWICVMKWREKGYQATAELPKGSRSRDPYGGE